MKRKQNRSNPINSAIKKFNFKRDKFFTVFVVGTEIVTATRSFRHVFYAHLSKRD